MALQTSMFPWQQENKAIIEETFSTWSVLRCYNQDQLAIEFRELLGFGCGKLKFIRKQEGTARQLISSHWLSERIQLTNWRQDKHI
jgi:hypothetical protein